MRNDYSLADIAAATGNNNNGFGGFGGDGWAWIIVLFLIFGWGNNGFGGNSGAADNYVLASDFATIQRQLSDNFTNLTSQSRYIQNGLCDGFYAMNTSLLNGFAGVNNAIMTNGYETRNAIQGVSSQLSNCCCSLEKGQMETNYLNAQNTCALQNTMNMNTRDIVDTVNANYRALHDEIVANRIEDKNAQITAQQNEINALRLAASQERQNNYLLSELKPCAKPSYVVQPNTPVTFPTNCCGQYNGCNGNVTVI